jgi:hypothetical protein
MIGLSLTWIKHIDKKKAVGVRDEVQAKTKRRKYVGKRQCDGDCRS